MKPKWFLAGAAISVGVGLWLSRRRKDMEQSSLSVLRLADAEHKNLMATLQFLGDSYDRITDIERLYDSLPGLCSLPNDADTNDATFAAGIACNLTVICRREVTLAALTLLRGYRCDFLYHIRKGIEACAFGAKMVRHPHIARTWLKAGETEDSFEEFRKKFAKDLYPKNEPDMEVLWTWLDVSSKAIHASPYGVAHYFACAPRDAAGPAIDVFDIGTYFNLVVNFTALVAVHLAILRIFERSLRPYGAAGFREWADQLSASNERYEAMRQRWRPEIEGELKRRATGEQP